MPEKVIGSPAEIQQAGGQQEKSVISGTPMPSNDDGITNPHDGRGPLRPRDDQAVKLPLRPPH